MEDQETTTKQDKSDKKLTWVFIVLLFILGLTTTHSSKTDSDKTLKPVPGQIMKPAKEKVPIIDTYEDTSIAFHEAVVLDQYVKKHPWERPSTRMPIIITKY